MQKRELHEVGLCLYVREVGVFSFVNKANWLSDFFLIFFRGWRGNLNRNVLCTYCRLSFDDADPEAFVGLRCKAMFCNFWVITSVSFHWVCSYNYNLSILTLFIFFQVYWPMDLRSYIGYVKGYDRETKIHHVRRLLIWIIGQIIWVVLNKKFCAFMFYVYMTILSLLFEISSFH